jgi:hypothetical protein
MKRSDSGGARTRCPSSELRQSLEETLVILGDEELMTALRQSLAEAGAGRTVPWEEVKGELGL